MGNPSASYGSAKKSQKIMGEFREEIAKLCDFDVDCTGAINPRQYHIIFTSGASESNSTIIARVCDAYLLSGKVPHIITSAIEHKSLLDAIQYHVDVGRCTATHVRPAINGVITPTSIESAILPQTALVCIMAANNETGAINDIAEIGKIAHAHHIPFYTDAVQSFGKYGMKPVRDNVDGFCASFHKLYGPVGCGLLVLKREWVDGYNLRPLIFGAQNSGMRGGTENITAIAGSRLALRLTMLNRAIKNKELAANKLYICREIAKRAPARTYAEYMATRSPNEVEIIFFDCDFNNTVKTPCVLPNTIFLSIIKRSNPPICNTRFKETLERNNIIISVGSACNTASEKASHVLYALRADELIRKGALRISLGDTNTREECTKFVAYFLRILADCVKQNHLAKNNALKK